jgi:ADP-heptose:LPS heptosyltransferase
VQVVSWTARADLELPTDGRPLVVTVSRGEALGDAVLALPFFGALRAAAPAAFRLHVTSNPTSYLFGALSRFTSPLLDAGIVGGHFLTQVLPRPTRLRQLPPAELAFLLFTRWLDVALLRPAVRARRRFTLLPGYRLSDGAPACRRRPPNQADRLLSLIEAAWGTPAPPPPLPLLVPFEAAARTAARLLPAPGEGEAFRGYVGISLGRRPDPRAWPVAQGAEVVAALAARGWRPVLLVGPLEIDTLPELRSACPAARIPLAEDGRPLDLETMLAVAARLRVAVVKDGGLAHLVTGAGVPAVALVANGRPRWNVDPFEPRKWAPVGAPVALVAASRTWQLGSFGGEAVAEAHDPPTSGAPAAPASAFPRLAFGRHGRDSAAISPATVLAALDGLLARPEVASRPLLPG